MERWGEQCTAGVKTMRFAFMGLTDEDLTEIIERLKGNEDVVELDLTHNKIMDKGIQSLVAALAAGAAPNLKEVRIYTNDESITMFRKTCRIRTRSEVHHTIYSRLFETLGVERRGTRCNTESGGRGYKKERGR